MNSQSTHQIASQTSAAHTASAAHAGCCREPDCGAGLRNNYFDGKRLTPDSFQVEQRYMLDRRRLLNRAIHGWGVVYGYSVAIGAPKDCRTMETKVLKIGAGLALDECGRELLVSELEIEIGDVIWLNAKGANLKAEEAVAYHNAPNTCWQLKVHYAEQSINPVKIKDVCNCEYHEWDRICETVRFSLQPVQCKECCQADDCELVCKCHSGPCCGETEHPGQTHPAHRGKRGGCSCLCEHLTKWKPENHCGSLCEIKEACGHVKVDLQHGVRLACLTLAPRDCERPAWGEVYDACGPRRLVKRNDLLFDLIRGCDLTRISEMGWASWHRRKEPVAFKDFAAAFGQYSDPPPPDGQKDLFYVTFSLPVRADTLGADCFAMTVLTTENKDGWWETLRVPIVGVDTQAYSQGAPKGYVYGVKMVFDIEWLEDGLRGANTIFESGETQIEIAVRGDFILDCNGQALDANGNGTPGDVLVSTFRVEAAESNRSNYRRQGGKS